MKGKIITHSGSLAFTTASVDIDFDKIPGSGVELKLEADLPDFDFEKNIVRWEIWDTVGGAPRRLDENDPTRGKRAVLRLLKVYAGLPYKPHVFNVYLKDKDGNLLTAVDYRVFCTPGIEKAIWLKDFETETELTTAALNTKVTALIKSYGYFGETLRLQVFKIQEAPELYGTPTTIAVMDLPDLHGLHLKSESFVLMFAGLISAAIPFAGSPFKLRFELYHEWRKIFTSKDLNVDPFSFEKPEPPPSTDKVSVIHKDEYFQQSYEPCKYEKINFRYGDQSEVIFDEKEASAVRSPRLEKNILAGSNRTEDWNGAQPEKVNIQLSNVETLICQYDPEEIKYLRFESEEAKQEFMKEHPPHGGHVIGVKSLEENAIQIVKKTDSELEFIPGYPYAPNDEYMRFLSQFLFSGPIEMEIPFETCRYTRKLFLNLYPDILWTFHMKYGEGAKDFYFDEEAVPLITGIKTLQEYARKYLYPVQIPGMNLTPLLLEYLASEAEEVSLGLHARHSNRNTKLDYTGHFRKTTEMVIYEMVAIQLVLEILLIVLTEGSYGITKASKALTKVQKVVKKAAKAKKELEAQLQKLGFDFELKMPAISVYTAAYYENLPEDKMGMVVEHGVKLDPLLQIKYHKELTLGKLLENREKQGGDKLEGLQKVVKMAGFDVKLTFDADGKIAGTYKAKFRTAQQALEVIPIVGDYLLNKATVTNKTAVSLFVFVDGNAGLQILNFHGDIKVKANAKGAVSYSRTYGMDETGVWVQDILHLSEVNGEYMVRASVDRKGTPIYDTNPKETPVPFVALTAREIPFPKVYIFKV